MIVTSKRLSLKGMRIVISGAIPPREQWSAAGQDRAILEFLRDFTRLVFLLGGTIVHGCHPTFAPVLAEQARRFLGASGSRGQLKLVMSRLWEPMQAPATLQLYERVSELHWTDAVGEGGPDSIDTKSASLVAMRHRLLELADVVVAVGGVGPRAGMVPGVDQELSMARQRGMACFMVGRLGGQVACLSRRRLKWFSRGNAMKVSGLKRLLYAKDVAGLAGFLVSHLAAHCDALLTKRPPIPVIGRLALPAIGRRALPELLSALAEPLSRSRRRGQFAPGAVASIRARALESVLPGVALAAYLHKRPRRRRERALLASLFGRGSWLNNALVLVSPELAMPLYQRRAGIGFVRLDEAAPANAGMGTEVMGPVSV